MNSNHIHKVLSGGCLCGHVRYEYEGEPEGAIYCHCSTCRRMTGSAFNVGVRAQTNLLNIISGNVKGYTRKMDDGNEITREFCPECGSPLFTRSPAHPDFVFIKAGSLDDPNCVKPTYQMWTEEAVPWAHIDENITSYPQTPTPPSDDIAPPGDEITPLVDEITPLVDEIIRSADEITPPADEITPLVDEITPLVDEIIRSADEITPPADEITPLVDEITPPITILKKQAEILETQTKGTLKGLVWHFVTVNKISIRLDILAQNLDDYSMTVLRIEQPLNIYPLRIFNEITNEEHKVENEEEFISTLRSILSSNDVKRVIKEIFSQSKK